MVRSESAPLHADHSADSSSGLALAARLKALGVPNLIIERAAIIGDVWRNRYEYLSLHFPHWADHFPYFPYPEHWPTYTPAQKLGHFMEWYASAMELAVWTSSSVVKADQDAQGNWTVQVNKGGKETRTLKPKHVVSTVIASAKAYRLHLRSWRLLSAAFL